jgi:hypothetical protein
VSSVLAVTTCSSAPESPENVNLSFVIFRS